MKRGEVYYIENDNSVGCEQRGIRPAVIVGNFGERYCMRERYWTV